MFKCRLRSFKPSPTDSNYLVNHLLRVCFTLIHSGFSKPLINALNGKLRMWFGVNELATELAVISALAHDVGKACVNHQLSITHGKPSFKYHEVVSAAILAEALSECPELIAGDAGWLYSIPVIAVINHHQGMRLRGIKALTPGMESEVLVRCGGLSSHLIEDLQVIKDSLSILGLSEGVVSRVKHVINALILTASEVIEHGVKYLHELMLSVRDSISCNGGYSFINEFMAPVSGGSISRNYPPAAAYAITSVLTGLLMISDDVVAGCERVESVLNTPHVTGVTPRGEVRECQGISRRSSFINRISRELASNMPACDKVLNLRVCSDDRVS